MLPTALHVLLLLSSSTHTGQHDACFRNYIFPKCCLVYGCFTPHVQDIVVGNDVINKYTYSCIQQRSAPYSVHVCYENMLCLVWGSCIWTVSCMTSGRCEWYICLKYSALEFVFGYNSGDVNTPNLNSSILVSQPTSGGGLSWIGSCS